MHLKHNMYKKSVLYFFHKPLESTQKITQDSELYMSLLMFYKFPMVHLRMLCPQLLTCRNSEKPAVLLPVERLTSGPIMDAKVTTILLVLLMAHLAFTETCKCTQLRILGIPYITLF
jgi:hypothetical protein